MKLYQDAERFLKDIYFSHSHDGRSKLNVEQAINDKLIADNKNKDVDYYSHRMGVVHSSSLYGCLRGVTHKIIGSPTTKEMQARQLGVFQAGHLFEDFVIEALKEHVIEQQREYNYTYKNLTLVGRSDFVVNDGGVIRLGENKSVHSDSFWYRQREGTLVAYHNQIQLQIYMWLERELFQNEWDGLFTYVSKDDCTVQSAAVKFNPQIINEVVLPALDILSDIYGKLQESGLLEERTNTWKLIPEGEDPMKNLAFADVQGRINAMINENVPMPDLAIFNESKKQWQKNWLCTYNDYDVHCYGAAWLLEAADTVSRKNKEYKLRGTM